jgi:20S proteasome alpha/beta subunit
MKAFGRVVTITAADNVLNQVVEAFTVPAGFVVTGVIAVSTVLGAGMTYGVGDSGSATRYLAAAAGSAVTPVLTLVTTSLGYKNTVETTILITVSAAGAANPAGTITLYLLGFIDR